MKKDCVEFYVDGRESWKTGILGWLLRGRGILSSAFVMVITIGTPWWINPDFFSKSITIPTTVRTITLIFVLSLGILFILGLLYLRFRTLRSLDIKYILHDLEHVLRDDQTDFFTLEKRDRLDKRLNNGEKQAKYIEFHDYKTKELLKNIGRKTKDYFRRLCDDSTIEIAVRLAEEKIPGGEIEYVTRCRTSGLNKAREEHSQPIAINEGIPYYFLKRAGGEGINCRGVLNYNDLLKASELGAFKKTKNEELFPDEIVTMMVAPLNAWSGSAQSTIGILYVTSRKNNTFSKLYTDSVLFVADMISKSIAFAVSVGNKIEKKEGDDGQGNEEADTEQDEE